MIIIAVFAWNVLELDFVVSDSFKPYYYYCKLLIIVTYEDIAQKQLINIKTSCFVIAYVASRMLGWIRVIYDTNSKNIFNLVIPLSRESPCQLRHSVKCVTLPSASPCQVRHIAKCITSASPYQVRHPTKCVTLPSVSPCQVCHLSNVLVITCQSCRFCPVSEYLANVSFLSTRQTCQIYQACPIQQTCPIYQTCHLF